jgi:molybdopterin synthase catalytic subunit
VHRPFSATTPPSAHEWYEITSDELPVGVAYEWAVLPQCGAVVLFSGTVRDHADGRSDVVALDYEAYVEAAIERFAQIGDETRRRYPTAGRIVLWHRIGHLGLGESSVIAVVSAPHRPEAFEAARFAIDALKESAPIWKKEHWSGGSDWGTDAHDLVSPRDVAGPQ